MIDKPKYTVMIDLIGLGLLCVMMLMFAWVGHFGSDDQMYISAAQGWIKSFPYIGHSHWALRHALVIPMAICFRLFGINEFTSILPSIGYYTLFVILSYAAIRYIVGRKAGLITALLIATSPLLAINGTMCMPDVPEGFFVFLSIITFYIAISKQQHFKLLILAGILMALAWYTRVTAIGLGLFYLILFIKGWGGKRSRYVYVAAVFLLLIGAECFYFLCLEGNPIHRITTVLHTHMGGGGGGKLPGTGNVVAEALGLHILEPFLVLLFNQEFALLFWFAIPAMLLGLRYKSWQTHEKRIFFYISFLCLVWFVFVSYLMPGRLLPRYYNVAVVTACIAMGIFISNIFDRRRVLSMSILATIISFNMFSVYVENKDPLFGECSLLELSLKYDETIYTDPYTASRASFLLETEGKSVGISTPISVPDGSLYFYNPNRVLEGHQPKGFSEKYSPLKTWKKLETISQERKLIGIILEKLNLNSYVPTSIYKKLNCPNGPVHLFRTFPQ